MFDIVALLERVRGYGVCIGWVARGPVAEIDLTRFLRSAFHLTASEWRARARARGLASRPRLLVRRFVPLVRMLRLRPG